MQTAQDHIVPQSNVIQHFEMRCFSISPSQKKRFWLKLCTRLNRSKPQGPRSALKIGGKTYDLKSEGMRLEIISGVSTNCEGTSYY